MHIAIKNISDFTNVIEFQLQRIQVSSMFSFTVKLKSKFAWKFCSHQLVLKSNVDRWITQNPISITTVTFYFFNFILYTTVGSKVSASLLVFWMSIYSGGNLPSTTPFYAP